MAFDITVGLHYGSISFERVTLEYFGEGYVEDHFENYFRGMFPDCRYVIVTTSDPV